MYSFVKWLRNSSATVKLYAVHRGELRHPPLHLNPSCGHAEPRWKLHFSPSPTRTVSLCRHTAAKRDGVRTGPGTRERKKRRKRQREKNSEEEEDGQRGIKKRCYSKCSDGAGREERLGNSTFHPSPATTVRANISLLVLAGSSQAVRERSGKLQRDRLTVRLSLSLIA